MQAPRTTSSSFPQLNRLRAFKHIFQSLGRAAIMWDPTGRIEQANPAAERLFGWNAGELAGRRVQELVAPGQPVVLLDDVVAAEGRWTGLLVQRRKSGAVFQASLTVTVVADPFDEPLGLIGLIEDDTPSRRRRARLNGLMRLGASLNAEHDPDKVLDRLCRDARELFAVDGALLSSLEQRTNALIFRAADGPNTERVVGRSRSVDNLETATVRAAINRRPELQRYESLESTPVYVRPLGTKCALAVPLLRGDRVLGVLTLTDTQRCDRFGPEEADHARVFAQLAAVALQDARLHEAERAENDRWLTLARVSQLLTASVPQRQVFGAVTGGALRLLKVDEVRLWLLEAACGPFKLAHVSPDVPSIMPTLQDYFESRMGQVLRTGVPWQAEDLASDDPEHWEITLERGLRASLVVPLVAGERRLGCINFLSRRRRTFDPDDLGLAQAFADQAALAVRNAQTFESSIQDGRLAALLRRAQRLSASDQQRVRTLLGSAEWLLQLALTAHP